MIRREFIRVGPVVLGGLLAPAPAGGAKAGSTGARGGRSSARACILLYLDGGPSHIDLWDMKPGAPAEIRGPFRPIATTVPGLAISELLPLSARQVHRMTLIRSVRHEEMVHDPAVYQMLTGRKHVSSAGNLSVQADDFPQMAAAFGWVDRTRVAMPRVIELPETMRMGGRILPGQNAGFLGRTFDPFRVEVTPEAEVVPPEFGRWDEIPPRRQARRASLLEEFDRKRSVLDRGAAMSAFDGFREQAIDLLGRPQSRRAFDLDREPAAVRDRYGRNRHGQSVLLARRLVEAGTRFVTVYWGRQEQDWADGKGLRPANNPWDTHRNHFPLVRDQLTPPADRALSALIEDLHERGLLAETLVVWMGDFGRTPRISKFASRDHWPHANTVLMAGAGVPEGLVHGGTDRIAAEVVEHPVSPADLTATIFTILGLDPAAKVTDHRGLSHPISTGRAIDVLLRG
jgi:hypothetical protein